MGEDERDTTMGTIVVHPTNGRAHREDVLAHVPDADVVEPDSADAVGEALTATDGPVILFTNNDSWRDEYLDDLSEGDWVATTATGYDIYPLDRFEERGVVLTHTPGVYGQSVSEHAFAMVLTFSRRLFTYREQQSAHAWRKRKAGMTDFVGDVCCVVGIGRVGEEVARRARAFGMTVRGIKRSVEGYDGAAHDVYADDALLEALDDARIVVITVPLTEETVGLIGEAELAACADDAIVVNVARGPILDTDALVAALEAGTIRAAGIDVFDEEPLPAKSPLWERDDVIATPHMSGWSDKLPRRALEMFAEEYERWLADEPFANRVV